MFRGLRCLWYTALVLAFGSAARGADEPAPGTVLGPDTVQQAGGLLPEEIAARYQKGEFRHEVVTPLPGTQWTDPAFEAAASDNRGRYAVDDAGTIVDPATGIQPRYIFGPPFPAPDPADPQAGVKLIWNFFYQSYLLGDNHNLIGLTWIARQGVDRQVTNEVWQKYYDGQPPGRPRSDNPNNLLFQQLVETRWPADLQGTVALTWRYRDTKRDSMWAYVPAVRRVRAISPTNRSDGFLGSDMSQDDGVYFDGKPEDFTWRYVGDAEMLCLYDRAAILQGEHDIRPVAGGGWRVVSAPGPRFAWEAPDAGLVSWAPLPSRTVLVKRTVHIVEAVPKDRYYLHGRLVLRLEKGTYVGCYNSKFDWKGSLLNTYMPLRGVWFRVGDASWRPYTAAGFTLSQNFKLDRATASHPDADAPTVPSDSLIPMDSSLFDFQSMVQRGR